MKKLTFNVLTLQRYEEFNRWAKSFNELPVLFIEQSNSGHHLARRLPI